MSGSNYPEQLPDYEDLVDLVEKTSLEITPAELHGIVTGSACTNLDNWVELVLPLAPGRRSAAAALSGSLMALFGQARQSLDSTQFEFNPALPDMDSSIDTRTAELAAWCRGFLVAFRHAGGVTGELADDAREVLADFDEIARAESGDGEEEELENALAELEEYIRVGTQIIFDDLNPVHTLH